MRTECIRIYFTQLFRVECVSVLLRIKLCIPSVASYRVIPDIVADMKCGSGLFVFIVILTCSDAILREDVS